MAAPMSPVRRTQARLSGGRDADARRPAHSRLPLGRGWQRLAPDQRAAATAPPGPVLCVAPAGSGKTTTVVARLAWRVAAGRRPGHGLRAHLQPRAPRTSCRSALTLRSAELGHGAGSVRVRTFHALGREILADAGVDVSPHRRARRRPRGAGRRTPARPTRARHLDDAFTRLKLDPERGPPTGRRRDPRGLRGLPGPAARAMARSTSMISSHCAGPTLRTRPPACWHRWRARTVGALRR